LDSIYAITSCAYRTMLTDFRCAIQSLRRKPGFVAIAVSVLVLGIGVCTVAYSVIDAAQH